MLENSELILNFISGKVLVIFLIRETGALVPAGNILRLQGNHKNLKARASKKIKFKRKNKFLRFSVINPRNGKYLLRSECERRWCDARGQMQSFNNFLP